MNCSVCLSDEASYVRCSNSRCNTVICNECFTRYLEHCSKEINVLPKCPDVNCSSVYIYKNIRSLACCKQYYEVLYNYLSSNNADLVVNMRSTELLFDKIRSEKYEFVNTRFPESISKLISISFKTKLNGVNKKNIKKQTQAINNIRCYNILCNSGVLIDFKCNVCNTTFCKNCDQKNKSGHVCDNNDLANKKYIETLVKCPKCKLPIVKGVGCRNVTCAVCKTNFDCYTGLTSAHGNHDNRTVILREKFKPSIEFQKFYDRNIITRLEEIETLEPKDVNLNQVATCLKKIFDSLENNNDSGLSVLKLKIVLAQRYSHYIIKRDAQKLYTKCNTTIVDAHDNGVLGVKTLDEILAVLL